MAIQPPADMSTLRQSAAAGSSSQPMTPLASSPPSRNAEQNGQAEPFAASNPASASATRSGTSPAMSKSGTGARRRPNYKLTQTIYAHKRAVTALKWTADGRMLVSAGADGYVHLFSMTTTTTTTAGSSTSTSTSSLSHFRTLRCHRSGINAISLSPDDLYFATASDDGTARIFALPSPHLPSSLDSRRRGSAEGNGDNGDDASGASDAASSSTSRMAVPLRTLGAHTAPILSLAFSPRSNLLVTGSFDESAIVWDVRTGTALKKLPAHSEAVWTTGWDREGGVVLTGSADGLVRLWDASSGQCLKTLDNETNSPVTCALFTPNPFYLMTATASPETTVRVYNIHTARVVKTLRPEGENGAQVGLGLASGATGGDRIPVICAFTQAPPYAPLPKSIMATTSGSNGAVAAAGESAEGDAEMDGNLAEAEANALAESVPHAQNVPQTKTGTPDTWVMAGTDKGGVIVWDLATRSLAQVMEGHMAGVLALAIHPSGAWVASGSAEPERTIKIWKHVDE